MKFVVELYRIQIEAGRTFLHEQPAYATSWALPEIKKMMREEGVDVWQADQCMSGLRTWGRRKNISVLANKPTRFEPMTCTVPRRTHWVQQCDVGHDIGLLALAGPPLYSSLFNYAARQGEFTGVHAH